MKKINKPEMSIIFICIIIILPLFIISIYNRPSADDFDYGILTHQIVKNNGNFFELIKAAWDTNINFYNSWQGLYTSAFILSLQPGIFGENYYAYTTLIIISISYLCLLLSIHILNKNFLKKNSLFTITVSTVILSIIMLCMPSPIEGLYWYNGSMNYMPFIFLTLLNVSLLFEAIRTENRLKRNMMILISTMLSFIISGGNHVTSFENILLLIVAIILCIKNKNCKKITYVLGPLISACIGFLIMYLAPGTQIRQTQLAQQGIIETIFTTLNHFFNITNKWCSLTWIVTLLLITPTAIEFATKNKEKFSKSFPLLPILIFITIVCGMFCVPYFSMGNFGAGRITNVIWITFMFFSWIIYFYIWGYLVKNNIININKLPNSDNKYIMIVICIFILFIMNSNSLKAITELCDNTAYNYSIEIDERTKTYNDSSLNEVGVYPLKTISELLFFSDIGPNPNIWPNTSISEYYNKTIYLIEEN